MSSPPIKTGAGPRNVTSSKYVLTSAQAKNVDSRPPYPNSADDNGASDVDISHQEVGDDLGDGGHLAEINEEEEGEMSREMLIAMAELTFDWLKPPEKKRRRRRNVDVRKRAPIHLHQNHLHEEVVMVGVLSLHHVPLVALVVQHQVQIDINN